MVQKIVTVVGIFLLFTGCSNSYRQFVSNYPFRSADGQPDYSNSAYWAALPDKWDPSDSVPLPLRNNYHPDTSVDIFFIHPTTYTDMKKPLGLNAPIDEAALNAKTDYSTILFQASIFNEAGRIYAPRYRQANLSCYFPKTKEDSLQSIAAFELAYEDVKAAFLYYLEHDNHGRPIIIASHSQGTNHAERLLKEFFDGKELQKQLVVAYLVGMPLKPGYFQSIKPCTTSAETGCACSWRTFKKGYKPAYVKQEDFVSIVTNPLSWNADIPTVNRFSNKGGLLLNFNKVVKHVTNASINGGILWSNKPHFFGNLFLTTKNYHVADMNFYYMSIRENAAERIKAYTKK